MLIDAATKIPLAVKVVPIHKLECSRCGPGHPVADESGRRAPAAQDGLDPGVLWWLDQHRIIFVVPVKDNMAVAADARAQVAPGEGITVGRRVHAISREQSRAAGAEVVGITALTTYDQYGTPEHGRQHHRRVFEADPIHAMVVSADRGGTTMVPAAKRPS